VKNRTHYALGTGLRTTSTSLIPLSGSAGDQSTMFPKV